MIALWTAPQGGAWTRLPGPVTAWSILRTDRLGKDSFRVELADAALPDGRLRFSARVDGVGWFTGLADEVLRTESGAGRRLVLRGRGMDALLEDCEFDAQTGTGITPAALATRVLQPVGLSAWSDAQSATGTLKTALGSTGSSIVQDYCASGRAPAAAYAGRRPGVPDDRAQERRHGAAGRHGAGALRAGAGGHRRAPRRGNDLRKSGGRPRNALAQRTGLAAAAEFARSMRGRDAVRLTLPGTHALEPGTTAEYGGPDADAHGLRPPRQRGRHYHGADAGGNLGGGIVGTL